MEVYSIGFAGHSAERFFSKLETAGVRRLRDIRLNNVSQLAGFAKRDDLRFFLRRISEVEYLHDLQLAPTEDLLKAYRAKTLSWSQYEARFLELMANRKIEKRYSAADFVVPTSVLCSEERPQHCHRRLVLEYLRSTSIPDLVPVHL